MRKIVVDMQNFLFADSVATAFKKSDYEIDVVRTESSKDTVELCKLYKPFVLYFSRIYTQFLLGGSFISLHRINLIHQIFSSHGSIEELVDKTVFLRIPNVFINRLFLSWR